jgi:putative DNA primase/helicase
VKQTNYSKAVGKKTLCAAVARAYRPGVKFDHMLILEGEQGIGKSTAVNILAGEWYVDLMLKTDSKDTVQLVNSGWILEVSEMAGLRKQEIESLKAFISRPTDSIRPPFGRTPVNYPRRSIFIGTINPTSIGYLNDETGNRRYWPVLCTKVKMIGLRRDREQIFAEALVEYRNGEKLYLTDLATIEQAMRIQETRSMVHPWQQVVREYLTQNDITRTTVKDLFLDAVNGDVSRFRYTERALIINIMRQLGWQRDNAGRYTDPKLIEAINDILGDM